MDPKSQRPIGDLESSPSIRVASKVTPTAEFLQQPLHLHRDHGLRYPYHPATNPGKLSTSYTQLLTTANNNNYGRLQSPSSPSSSSLSSPYEEPYEGSKASSAYNVPSLGVAPHRHEVRVKETHHAHLDGDLMQQHRNHYHHHHHHHHQPAPIYREQSMMGGSRLAAATSSSSYPSRQQISEIEQELLQQASNQQLSNLVPDNPRPMSHGMKYTYPAVTGPQILYSRPMPPHHATNYHHLYSHPHHYHHYQPDQRSQLMIIKRPMLTRRPMLQSPHHALPQPTLPLPSRPVFLERKKAVYRPASSTYRRTPEKLAPGPGNPQIAKFKKIDAKQRNKIEAKLSDVDGPNVYAITMKPARNTGFNPDSIVIEGGFKPIIRNVDRSTDVAQKRISDRTEQNDAIVQETNNHRLVDSFEPVFIPSPPVPTIDTAGKSRKKNVNAKSHAVEPDDMEMAADRTNAYYLPPVSSAIFNESPSSSSAEVLITFDGKKVKDSSLARSISGIEEHSKGKLSSDSLSRTPQFGRFKGELPPLIGGEVRSDGSQLEKRRLPSVDLSTPEIRAIKNTKLTLITRSKRSPHEGYVRGIEPQVNHSEHNHHHSDHHEHQDSTSLLVSAGQTFVANFGYILLTVVFYYII